MDILLDTHTLIWSLSKPTLIPENSRSLIKSIDNKCYVSIASLWEVAIKFSLGRLIIESDLDLFFNSTFESGLQLLPISENHVLSVATLPFHRKDPFDRIIIAQAKTDNLTIISKDPQFKNYDITVIW